MVRIVCFLLLSTILCYAFINIKKLYTAYKNSERKKGFLYALYFSVFFTLLVNPLGGRLNQVSKFKRVIGQGLAHNTDISKRINNFSLWFLIFGIAYIIFYLLANYLHAKDKGDEVKKVNKFLDQYMVLANVTLLLRCITYFNDAPVDGVVYYFSAMLVLLIAVVAIAYIGLNLEKNITADSYAKLMIIVACLSHFISIIFAGQWGIGRLWIGIMTIAFTLVILCIKVGSSITYMKRFEIACTHWIVIISLLPVMTSLYIELIHVLNQYGVFVAYPKRYYFIAIISMFLVCRCLMALINKKGIKIINWKKWSYPILVFGFTCLSIQIPIQLSYNPHIFESANYSILISDFFNHGKIPIIEHYGGHMMSQVWEGILYGLINGDYAGAVVSPYSPLSNIVLAVLFFFLIKNIWDEDIALLVALLFPFLKSWEYYGLGILICLAAMAYIRKKSYTRAIILWLATIWCALYRLDLGFAFGLALIIAMAIYIICYKNWHAMKQLLMTLIGLGVITIVVWCIACISKSINPINRLMEFLAISLSNGNWAYPGVGDTTNTVFAWGYIIIPFVMIICLLSVIFSKEMRERIGNEKWILLLILGFSYFMNFSRGLVRHSLQEMSLAVVIWSAYLFLTFFFSCFIKNKNLFLPILTVFILLNNLFMHNKNFMELPIADKAVLKPEPIIKSWTLKSEYVETSDPQDDNLMTYWERLRYNKEVVPRVNLNQDIKNIIGQYKVILDTLLNKEDTFVDFMNKTFLYSVIGKENPVYVSQSPLQLSGEFTQQEFIKEIKGVPVVLMPIDENNEYASNTLDGIRNAYRYYQVAEYIYQNYVPLCRYDSVYSIWCLPGRYEEFRGKLSGLIQGKEYHLILASSGDMVHKNNVELLQQGNFVKVHATGIDPMIKDVHNIIDTSSFIGSYMNIVIDYTTDVTGPMQVFYTTEQNEDYTAQKVVTVNISESGTASFSIPVTEFTRIRLDTPEGSNVIIKSLIAKTPCDFIEYGYDGPIENADQNGNISYSYISGFHNYNLYHLPRIWAEADTKNAINNKVITNLQYQDGIYLFDSTSVPSVKGNYLKITATYDGQDTGGLSGEEDESIEATVIIGDYKDGAFAEKCRYNMILKEGTHDYLIRISTDYYWYTQEENAVKIQPDSMLRDVTMQILEGD